VNFSLYYNSVTKVVADFIPELGDKVGHEFCRPTFGHSYPLLSIGPKVRYVYFRTRTGGEHLKLPVFAHRAHLCTHTSDLDWSIPKDAHYLAVSKASMILRTGLLVQKMSLHL